MKIYPYDDAHNALNAGGLQIKITFLLIKKEVICNKIILNSNFSQSLCKLPIYIDFLSVKTAKIIMENSGNKLEIWRNKFTSAHVKNLFYADVFKPSYCDNS